MKALLGCLLLLVGLAWPVAARPDEARADVDAIFKAYRNRPGVALAVVYRGRVAYQKGYGLADVRRKLPIDQYTMFDLASVSKQFTATSVLLLCRSGQMALDAPLGKYLKGLPEYAARVKVRRLLNMTSGLPDYYDAGENTTADLIDDLKSQKQSFKAGSRYEYLNMNYALLSRAVEAVTATPFGTVLQNNIFKPLGMTHTVFLGRAGQVVKNRAVGYRPGPQGTWVYSRNDAPGIGDGNVFSCTHDMAIWAIDLLNGSSILRPAELKEAWTPGRLNSGKPTEYGLGFEVETYEGERYISHRGSWDGTRTYIALYPDRKLGLVLLSNNEEEEIEDLADSVAECWITRN